MKTTSPDRGSTSSAEPANSLNIVEGTAQTLETIANSIRKVRPVVGERDAAFIFERASRLVRTVIAEQHLRRGWTPRVVPAPPTPQVASEELANWVRVMDLDTSGKPEWGTRTGWWLMRAALLLPIYESANRI